jgi:hypothetical protein
MCLEDFRSIPSAQLTLEQFHTVDAEVEYDPPSYIRNVVRDASSVRQTYGEGEGTRRVRLALPGVKPSRGAPAAVGAAGYGERKSNQGDGSDSEAEAAGATGTNLSLALLVWNSIWNNSFRWRYRVQKRATT